LISSAIRTIVFAVLLLGCSLYTIRADAQTCPIQPTLTVSGPTNGRYHFHVEQVSNGACGGGAMGALTLTRLDGPCPSGCFSDGATLPTGIGDRDSDTCLVAGQYRLHWSGHCLHDIDGTCIDDVPHPETAVTFTVAPRAASIKVSAGAHPGEVRIDYDYGGVLDGIILGSLDGDGPVSVTNPDCHHPSGTCLVPIGLSSRDGSPHQVTVVISGCGVAADTLDLRAECGEDTSCDLSCPMCVASPVNVGSGNVKVTAPLFALAEPRNALSFRLTYDSIRHSNESSIDRPLGPGWTHSFNMQMRSVNTSRLQYVAPDGEVRFFDRPGSGTTWTASVPATSTDTVTIGSGEYLLQTLSGDSIRFDATTGRWIASTDRYANTYSGTYNSSGELTGITDPLGRTLTLAYSATKLASVTLWDGATTWQFHYSGGVLTGIGDPIHGSANWRAYAYTTDHLAALRLLTSVTDDSGAVLEAHAYDGQDRGTTSVAEGGRDSFTIEYDTPAYGESRVTETRGSVTQVTVYSTRYIGGIFYPAEIDGVCSSCGGTSDSQTFTYDATGRVLSRTDGEGHTTTYTYDGNGNVATATQAAGTSIARLTTYGHSYTSDPTFVTQTAVPSVTGSGQKVSDASWNTGETLLTTSVTGRLPSAPSTAVTYTSTTSFDGRHRVVQQHGSRTDVATNTTYVYYSDTDATLNRRGRLQSITDAAGLTTTYDDYDAFGTARTMTDANGVVTNRVTDGRGRVTTEINRAVSSDTNEPADYTRTMTYDSRDRLTQTTNARNFITQYVYESGTNRLTDTILVDDSGNQRERRHLTLDPSGHVLTEEKQSCNTPAPSCTAWTTRSSVSSVYDQKGRRVEVDQPVPTGAKSLTAYDLDGKVSSLQDENHTAPNTSYAYDSLDRLRTVTQKLGTGTVVTFYTYDVQDNLSAVTDPNGNVTTYQYDDFGRMQQQTSPVTGTTTYAYDSAGNLTSTTDANGATTVRTYDAANRVLTAVSTRTGTATETVTWTYDDSSSGHYGLGRLASMTDPAGETISRFERRGLLRAEERTTFSTTYATAFTYDANGNRTSVTDPSGLAVTYGFDFADRPVSATSPTAAIVSSAGYLPFGPMTTLAFGNGTTQTMQYDARYRPLENKLITATGTLAQYAYAEDAIGNITQMHDVTDATYDRDFAYDDLNRLVAADSGVSLWGSGGYTYDAMGNLLSSTVGNRTSVLSYSGVTPKLTQSVDDGNTIAMTYDAAGNESVHGGDERTYSSRNLLKAIQTTRSTRTCPTCPLFSVVTTETFLYDGRGVRVEWDHDSFLTRQYVYTPELHLLARTGFDSEVTDTFVWFADRPVAQFTPGSTVPVRYTFTDHLGTPFIQTDDAGAIVWRAEYEPYGHITAIRQGVEETLAGYDRDEQPLRLPGQEFRGLTETGTEEDYNIFRWYKSGWGRYTQADPIGVQGRGIDVGGVWRRYSHATAPGRSTLENFDQQHAIQPYAYAANNPLLLTDRLGLMALRCNLVTMVSRSGPGAYTRCVMIGTCRSYFDLSDMSVVVTQIAIPNCFRCPRRCTVEAHGGGVAWYEPNPHDWYCTPWTPIIGGGPGPTGGDPF
jgi:RHS repeat-associated protein